MRQAVKTLALALAIVALSARSDADASLDTDPAVAVLSVEPLKFTIDYPYPSFYWPNGLPQTADANPLAREFSALPTPFTAWPELPRSEISLEPIKPSIPEAAQARASVPAVAPKSSSLTPATGTAPASQEAALHDATVAPAAPKAPPPEAASPAETHEAALPGVDAAPDELPVAQPRKLHRRQSKAPQRQLRSNIVQIAFAAPTLAPMAHTRFCLKYPADCRAQKIVFRGGPIELTSKRRAELVRVNAQVNRAISPMNMHEAAAAEKWLISPEYGDCNDYAVTKRHELLALGWPARVLLLAEVVTTWGEHHLVLVVRTREGDLVADSLAKNIRNWSATPYQWVRVESPTNPVFWSTVKAQPLDVAAMPGHDHQL